MALHPSLGYNPAHVNRWKSSTDLSFDPTAVVTDKPKRRQQDHSQRMGDVAGVRPFDFVPQEEVERLAARNYAHEQRLGYASITFGDSGGEPNFGNKYLPPKSSKKYPCGQVMGASSIALGAGGGGCPKPVQRSYPGTTNAGMGSSNVSMTLVPATVAQPLVRTRMGEENMDCNLQTVPGAAMKPPRFPTQMGKAHLSACLVPPVREAALLPTKMLEESAPPPFNPYPFNPPPTKAPPQPWHVSSPALNPPAPPLQRPEPPPRDPQHLFNKESEQETVPPVVRAHYPAARVPGGGAPGGAHNRLASHLTAATNSVDENVAPPVPARRGSYTHQQGFGAPSSSSSTAGRWDKVRRSRMGTSSLSTSTLG